MHADRIVLLVLSLHVVIYRLGSALLVDCNITTGDIIAVRKINLIVL